MAKTLQIIETAYRATLEEQDDPIVWIAHAMKGAGAELDVVLRGNAVNYLVQGQDASGLSFGERKQTQPPNLASDVAKLLDKDVQVFFVEEDVTERGLQVSELLPGMTAVKRAALPALLDKYPRVWQW
jgi:sulfur relay (sulfurtransferase) DsrF/TusC family protein